MRVCGFVCVCVSIPPPVFDNRSCRHLFARPRRQPDRRPPHIYLHMYTHTLYLAFVYICIYTPTGIVPSSPPTIDNRKVPSSFPNPVAELECVTAVQTTAGGLTTGLGAAVWECFFSHPLSPPLCILQQILSTLASLDLGGNRIDSNAAGRLALLVGRYATYDDNYLFECLCFIT